MLLSEAPDIFSQKLTGAERLSRALSFYKAAVPIFAAYWLKEKAIQMRRGMGEEISAKQEDAEYRLLHEKGSDELVAIIKELQGYYVKTGQILSTRKDIFPEEYTEKLAVMQDALDPLPGHVIKQIVRRELLDGAELTDLFSSFDDECLGSASIAQVHRATLLDGRVVAVKVQRPNVEGRMLADISNLKQFAKTLAKALPIDYYKVFSELERTLIYELDFLHEAQATAKMASAVSHAPNNKPRKPAVTIPLPIPGLVSRRVMVLEYIEGIPLSKLTAEMARKGIKAGSAESILLGKKLLASLTDAYSAMIFGSGMLHGDPHAGNIFIQEGGDISLLDCGQVKILTSPQKIGLAELVLQVNAWETLSGQLIKSRAGGSSKSLEVADLEQRLQVTTRRLADKVRSFGVIFKAGVGDECAAAVAILLFGNTGTILPGGFAGEEMSPDSPIVQVQQFPQELVLLGRATVLIKGIANRLGLPWGLSDRWAAVAAEAIAASAPAERQPIWAATKPSVATVQTITVPDGRRIGGVGRVKSKDLVMTVGNLMQLVRYWIAGKAKQAWLRLPQAFRVVASRTLLRLVSLAARKT